MALFKGQLKAEQVFPFPEGGLVINAVDSVLQSEKKNVYISFSLGSFQRGLAFTAFLVLFQNCAHLRVLFDQHTQLQFKICIS